ncbi:MAG: hypothetical protein QM496_12470 [Verrucomicrobiota bacterium]
MSLKPAIDSLLHVLTQEQTLLLQMSDSDYATTITHAFGSSPGKHIRHNLDHLTSFVLGFEQGHIDYEDRPRNERIEQCRDFALEEISSLMHNLRQLSAQKDKTLSIRCEIQSDDDDLQWLQSSCGRELQFLLSHSIHHHAIIAMLPVCQSLNLPTGFGIAPSTQRYQKNTSTRQSCAH